MDINGHWILKKSQVLQNFVTHTFQFKNNFIMFQHYYSMISIEEYGFREGSRLSSPMLSRYPWFITSWICMIKFILSEYKICVAFRGMAVLLCFHDKWCIISHRMTNESLNNMIITYTILVLIFRAKTAFQAQD